MKLSGGIVTYNNEKTIESCIASILDVTRGKDFSLTVYDNGSQDGTVDLIRRKFPEVRVMAGRENLGFGSAHNEILHRVHSDVHFVINPDIVMREDSFSVLADYLQRHPGCGLVTPKICNPDGTEQFLPKYCPTIRYVFLSRLPGLHFLRDQYTRKDHLYLSPEPVEFCTGCFFGAETAYLRKLGGFNRCFFMYCEDTDLSKRVTASGKQIIFDPETAVVHNWSRENTRNLRGIFRFLKSLAIYGKRWGVPF